MSNTVTSVSSAPALARTPSSSDWTLTDSSTITAMSRRTAGNREISAVLRHPRRQAGLGLDLENDRGICQVQLPLELRVQASEPADRVAVAQDAGGLPRVQRRVLVRDEPEFAARARRPEQRLDVGLHVEELDGLRAGAPLFREAPAPAASPATTGTSTRLAARQR